MKGIVLAGGKGTRLYPLTHVTNKHLLPVYDKPMIYYPIQTLINAGIEDIMVVVGDIHAGHFMRVLRNGEDFGILNLQYAYQEGSTGIAGALALTEDFADGDNVCVILGDNVTDSDIYNEVQNFTGGAKIFLKEVKDPQRFGVPVFQDNKIVKIEEKPEHPKSKYAVTGLYMYDSKVYDYIYGIKKSARGELEITDVNNQYIEKGNMSHAFLDGYWLDCGKFETLYQAGVYWRSKNEISS